MLSALRHRNLALLIAAQTVTAIGSFILFVGLPFYVYQLTGSGLATGALFIAQTIPQIALGSIAGVFVDRWDRRLTRVTADLARILVLLPLLAVPSTEWVWIVYAVALVEAAILQFDSAATLTLIPRLVPPHRLLQANSLNQTTNHLALLVGSALGGLLLALGGLTLVVSIDAASFLASALFVFSIPSALGRPEPSATTSSAASGPPAEPAADTAPPSVVTQWIEGLSLVRANRQLLAIFTASTLVGLADGLILAGIVVFVSDVLHTGEIGFGFLLTARGVGGIVGGLLVAQFGARISERRLMPFAILAMTVVFAGLANVHYLPFAMLMLLLTGPPSMAFMVSVQTLLQRCVADTHRGRVFGVYSAILSVAALLGMAISSTTLDSLGAVAVFNFAVAADLIATVALTLAFRTTSDCNPATQPTPEAEPA